MIRRLITIVLAAFALNAFAAADVNQASRAELESVKGIGPGLSGKIVEARRAGAFKSWTDLTERVVGIGSGNAARLSQAGLTVSGQAFEGTATPTKTAKARKSERTEKTEKARKSEG